MTLTRRSRRAHDTAASPSFTDALCTRCGLCCDGTLLADGELRGRAEADRLESLGLVILEDGDDGPQLQMPCAGLAGTRCSVYAHRPRCCRAFECQLLQDAQAGRVSVRRAQAVISRTLVHVRRAQALLGPPAENAERLPLRERVAEALAGEPGSRPLTPKARTALRTAMAAFERAVRASFLGPDAD